MEEGAGGLQQECVVEGRGFSLTEAATRSSGGFTRQALPSFFYSRSYFYSFPPCKHLNSSSFTKKVYCKVLPSFHWRERKNDIVSCSEIYQEILEEKIKPEIHQNLKEPHCRATAWREPVTLLGRRDTWKRRLNGQEASPATPSPAARSVWVFSSG